MSTIKDVARCAGVSIATVSRVLNKKGAVSPEAENAVTLAMQKLDYHPNHMARALVKGRNNTIGVILPSFNNPFWSEIAQEIEKSAKEEGYHVLFSIAGEGEKGMDESISYLRASQVCGIIQTFSASQEVWSAILKHVGLPLVALISDVKEVPSVVSDDTQGGLLATRHLIAKGCKNLVHISGDLKLQKHADDRSFAFIEECRKRGVAYRVYESCPEKLGLEDNLDLINRIFYENPQMDGIFASNDIMATQCISYARSQGFRIPDDIRIVGYDDISISALIYPPLTTVRQNYAQLSKTAVRAIVDMVHEKTPKPLEVVPVELIERKTT
ncbi:MAG TPA: LacI family transcriptional regulator [Candidatus Eisenbergiella merdigallinarum]|uniref:LacI family transcriptional regulator n=1 Tax=Candidatus Eisenbergiella merdigallinarum TaxID=2838552 RepID=A0A9D2MSF0_9FIRM|nr:LacI family transcriptional regulator [Candidatus Eisenbergiella merdigallinarum]